MLLWVLVIKIIDSAFLHKADCGQYKITAYVGPMWAYLKYPGQ
jgi:hypothetical protein